MKRILCPTDFSTVADNAIVFAAKLSKRLDATLHLINVQRLSDLTPEEALMGRDVNLLSATRTLDERCLEISKVFKISCYGEATTSAQSLSTELARDAGDYDLVVMGTNGEDAFFQHLFGSNTYQVINKSLVPVLAVPEACQYSEVRKLAYAFDYWRSDKLVLAKVVSLCEVVGCELVILQVMENSFSLKADEEIKHLQSMILDTYGERIPITFAVIHDSETSTAIHTWFLQSNADLLALCTPHHGYVAGMFHKSVVRSLVKAANYPVLVFQQ